VGLGVVEHEADEAGQLVIRRRAAALCHAALARRLAIADTHVAHHEQRGDPDQNTAPAEAAEQRQHKTDAGATAEPASSAAPVLDIRTLMRSIPPHLPACRCKRPTRRPQAVPCTSDRPCVRR
jgi:hypothetical protein